MPRLLSRAASTLWCKDLYLGYSLGCSRSGAAGHAVCFFCPYSDRHLPWSSFTGICLCSVSNTYLLPVMEVLKAWQRSVCDPTSQVIKATSSAATTRHSFIANLSKGEHSSERRGENSSSRPWPGLETVSSSAPNSSCYSEKPVLAKK